MSVEYRSMASGRATANDFHRRNYARSPPLSQALVENLRVLADGSFYYIKKGTKYTTEALYNLCQALYTTNWNREWDRLWQSDDVMMSYHDTGARMLHTDPFPPDLNDDMEECDDDFAIERDPTRVTIIPLNPRTPLQKPLPTPAAADLGDLP